MTPTPPPGSGPGNNPLGPTWEDFVLLGIIVLVVVILILFL